MRYTQYLVFEIGSGCNLGKAHPECPNTHSERYAHMLRDHKLNDDMIVRVSREMHERHGFHGLVAFHYFNEPMMYQDRLRKLVEAMPWANFTLWTNGTIPPHGDTAWLRRVREVRVTDYSRDGHPPVALNALAALCPVTLQSWSLDDRITLRLPVASRESCLRPFTEFIVDLHGNVHLCCYDWRGEASVGNVYVDELDELIRRWQSTRDHLARGSGDWPAACLHCAMRCGLSDNVREINDKTIEMLNSAGIKVH
jgi:hypothetical protein